MRFRYTMNSFYYTSKNLRQCAKIVSKKTKISRNWGLQCRTRGNRFLTNQRRTFYFCLQILSLSEDYKKFTIERIIYIKKKHSLGSSIRGFPLVDCITLNLFVVENEQNCYFTDEHGVCIFGFLFDFILGYFMHASIIFMSEKCFSN